MFKFSKMAVVLIIHYTYIWTPRCLRSFREHFPHETLIGIDNNPLPGQKVRKTRGYCGQDSHVNSLCQKESQLLKEYSDVHVVFENHKGQDVERLAYHGDVLDFVFQTFTNYEEILLIEPDCVFKGKDWLSQMRSMEGLVIGMGRVSDDPKYTFEVCPTLWRLQEIGTPSISMNKIEIEGVFYNTCQLFFKSIKNQCKTIKHNPQLTHFSSGTCIQDFVSL